MRSNVSVGLVNRELRSAIRKENADEQRSGSVVKFEFNDWPFNANN